MKLNQKLLKRYLKNRKQAKINANTLKSEEILLEDHLINEFANFHEKNNEELELVQTVLLSDYINCIGNFTPEELNAFRIGQKSITDFFRQCFEDVNLKQTLKTNSVNNG